MSPSSLYFDGPTSFRLLGPFFLQIAKMESDFEHRIAKAGAERDEQAAAQNAAEFATLKASIEELNEVVSDRNKVGCRRKISLIHFV